MSELKPAEPLRIDERLMVFASYLITSAMMACLAASMVPGARYLVTTVAENVACATAESQGLLILPEPVDTTEVSTDTTRVPPDTT